jgi:hypothetical protein
MKFFIYIPILTAFLTLISCSNAPDNLDEFKIFHGKWIMNAGEVYILESWEPFNDTLLDGKSYKISGTDTILTETIRLVIRNAEILYIPTVMDQNNGQSVEFKLTSSKGKTYIFENPAHDFPSKIIYDFKNEKNLNARIEGKLNGKKETIPFNFIKIE